MYSIIKNEKDLGNIIKVLPYQSINNIIQSGPILGILQVDCHFSHNGFTPVPSVVSSELVNVSFFNWKDIDGYLESLLHRELENENLSKIKDSQQKIIEISRNKELLFCYSVALFIESQMKVFSQSPYPAQNVVIQLIKSVLNGEKVFPDTFSEPKRKEVNTTIYITLHAGNKPFVNVDFTDSTIIDWGNELEAGIVLTIPQLLNFAIKRMDYPENQLLKEIINNQLLRWGINIPKIGCFEEWSWLPVLDIKITEKENEDNLDYEAEMEQDEINLYITDDVKEPSDTKLNYDIEDEKIQNILEDRPNYKKYIIYGFLMILPIPFINWLWLSLGILSAKKDGSSIGFKGIGIQLGIAFGGRLLLGLIMTVMGG